MDKQEKIDQAITIYYKETFEQVSPDLIEAILYSVNGGGKRIRPLILLEVLEGFSVDLIEAHYQVAAGLEMIHTGSLIHDDLPAMDDDDYRRGRLTSHKQFDEASAILAGDSLFLDPFGLIARTNLPDKVRVDLIAALSSCAGTFGMVGGQMLDMKGEEQKLSLTELTKIHANKTGKLLAFPFVAAGIIAEQKQSVLDDLLEAGNLVGHAFQVRDDILDVTASFEEIGKTPQKDLLAEKSTYPSLLGLEASYKLLNQELDQALAIFQKLTDTQGFHSQKILEIIGGLRLHA